MMFKKRREVIDKFSVGMFGISNPGDFDKYNSTHTVNMDKDRDNHLMSPFAWGLRSIPDLALQDEFDPGQVVVDKKTGKYGIVEGYVLDRWENLGSGSYGFRILDTVNVDFGDCRSACICSSIEKAKIPKNVMDLLCAKFEKEGLKERVHEKVDEAFEQ